MRKGDEDWVKKCMELSVECRRPVGRPRRTWLESVEADMTEQGRSIITEPSYAMKQNTVEPVSNRIYGW